MAKAIFRRRPLATCVAWGYFALPIDAAIAPLGLDVKLYFAVRFAAQNDQVLAHGDLGAASSTTCSRRRDGTRLEKAAFVDFLP